MNEGINELAATLAWWLQHPFRAFWVWVAIITMWGLGKALVQGFLRGLTGSNDEVRVCRGCGLFFRMKLDNARGWNCPGCGLYNVVDKT
jgi:hypothetical protein